MADTFGKGLVVNASQGFNSANKFSRARIDSMGMTFTRVSRSGCLPAVKALDQDGKRNRAGVDAPNTRINELASRAMRVLAFGYSRRG